MYIDIQKVLLDLREHTMEAYLENGEYISENYLCDIYLPTGKIIANDPLCMYEFNKISETVIPGKYPVYLHIHHIDTDKRITFAEIRFKDTKPQYYEESVSYGVDSATGCYMDASVAEIFKEYSKEQLEKSTVELSKLLDVTYTHTYAACNYELPIANIVAFSTGWGDGVYTTYLGYDSNKDICNLITYFDTLELEELQDMEVLQISEEEKQRIISKYRLER